MLSLIHGCFLFEVLYDIKGGYAGRIEITVQIVGVTVLAYMLAQTVKKTTHTWNPFALLS